MVRLRPPAGDEFLGERAADMHVQQSVAMDVAELLAVKLKLDAAQPMNHRAQSRNLQCAGLNSFISAQSPTIEEHGPGEQHRVEELWRQRNPAEPVRAMHDEFEDRHDASESRWTWRITRRCTARVMSRVHQSK